MTPEVRAIGFDFLGVVGHTRMAFDGDAPRRFVLDDAVADVIDAARRSGLGVALMSNNDRSQMMQDPIGPRLASMFDVLVFASDVANPKPHPDMFRRALRDLDVEAQEFAFVDDSARNCDMAELLGMQAHVAMNTTDVVAFVEALYKKRNNDSSFLPRRNTT